MHKFSDFLYVIGVVGARSPIKIGITSDPEKRIRQFRTAAAWPIAYACCLGMPSREIARGIEDHFHKRYGEQRTNGEWFDVEAHVAIDEICKYFNAFLHHAWCDGGMLDEDELREVRDATGLYMTEQKMAGLRWEIAWENQDAE